MIITSYSLLLRTELKRLLSARRGLAWEALRLADTRHSDRGDMVLHNIRGIRGIVLERYGNALVVSSYVPNPPIDEILEVFTPMTWCNAIFLKERFRGGESGRIWGETQVPFTVAEGNMLFEVNPAKGINPGLFLETRPLRRELATGLLFGRSVVNLFSYTSSLSVAAFRGGAISVVNVDSSKAVLKRARRNYELNSLPVEPQAFSLMDARRKIRSWTSRAKKFGALIVDPPPRMPGGMSGMQWLESNIQDLLALLEPAGIMIVIAHEPSLGWHDFQNRLGISGRRIYPDPDVWPGVGITPTKILVYQHDTPDIFHTN